MINRNRKRQCEKIVLRRIYILDSQNSFLISFRLDADARGAYLRAASVHIFLLLERINKQTNKKPIERRKNGGWAKVNS